MGEKDPGRPKFRLIQGGLQCSITLGPVRIVAAPETAQPFEVDALVYEEDTWLVINADPDICEPEEHPVRIMTEMLAARPEGIGRVLVRGGKPFKFLAIVHNVDMEPTCREEWVESALSKILIKAEQMKLSSLGIPLLGTIHGRLRERRFPWMLGNALTLRQLKYLKSIWLIAPTGFNREAIGILRSFQGGD